MKKPQCSRCGRALSDPFSIAVGMGPECRGGLRRKGWKFPKPKYQVRDGHVVLVGMVGKMEKPIISADPSTARPSTALRTKYQDEKREIVLRAKREGRTFREAVHLLHDYMIEKDSRMSILWCEKFASEVWKELK